MNTGKILVVMPMYNALPYLSKAIESILNQTYQNFEFIIIDDGSTDGSDTLIRSYSDNRVSLWNQARSGPGTAMNRAIQYAHEENIEFIARMDADDISLPRRLEIQLEILHKYPSVAACSSNCYYIDAISESITGTSTVSLSPKLIHWEIMHGLRGLIQGACTFRTEPLNKVGGYRSFMRYSEEVDLFLRLGHQYELVNTSEFLYKIRINHNSLSIQNQRENIQYQFYAIDCFHRSTKGNDICDFYTYISNLRLIDKWRIWREERVLKYWRNHLDKPNPINLLAAALLDPRRVFIRLLRKRFHR